MDPIFGPIIGSTIGGLISGGGSLLGGQQANAANSALNSATMQYNAQSQYNQNVENATQADRARAWSAQQLNNVMSFNDAEAGKQMDFQSLSQQKAMDFDAQQAAIQRAYETDMSNTAYQRAVTGMKAAGLNPILSAGTGGASTPSVSAPTVQAMSGAAGSVSTPGAASAGSSPTTVSLKPMADVFSPAISNALQGANIAMGLAKQIADIHNIEADTLNKQAGPSGTIPAIKKTIEDVAGKSLPDVVSTVKSVASSLLPPPGPGTAKQVGDAVESLGLGPSNTLPSGAPANIPSLVPGALGSAIKSEIQGWLNTWMSPPTTSFTPKNPDDRPYAGKVFTSSEIPTQGIMSGPQWKGALLGIGR